MLLHGLKAALLTVTQLATVHLEDVGEELAVTVPSLLPLSEGPPSAHTCPHQHINTPVCGLQCKACPSGRAQGSRTVPSSSKPPRANSNKSGACPISAFSVTAPSTAHFRWTVRKGGDLQLPSISRLRSPSGPSYGISALSPSLPSLSFLSWGLNCP